LKAGFSGLQTGLSAMEKGAHMNVQDIMNFLPHRYPFLLIDRIVEYEEGRRIVALKNVTINEPFFQGHFPGVPIMPGVLIIEALAQAGGVLVFKTLPEREKKLVFFMGIENARFRKPVRPGDQLSLEMEVVRVKPRVGKLRGKAYVEGSVVAEAEIMFSLVDREAAKSS
jgi:beta-hydroxyacyl-ACP dehydratase FabZ